MSTATIPSTIRPEPELYGQTVVVIGGSAGIGLETARRARAEGAKIVLPYGLPTQLDRFFRDLPVALLLAPYIVALLLFLVGTLLHG